MGTRNKQRRAEKRRNKERKRKKAREAAGERKSSLVMLRNPFDGLSDEERASVVRSISEKSDESYRESLNTLIRSLGQHDPFVLIATIVSHLLIVSVGDKGVEKSDSEFALYQSHVEILQALLLQMEPAKIGRGEVGADAVEEAVAALVSLMNAQALRRMSPPGDRESDNEKAVRLIQHWVRGNTQMVRNWGYFSQVRTIARELYCRLDERFKRAHGFTASNVIDVFDAIIERTEQRQTKRFSTLSQLYQLKDKRRLVEEFQRAFELSAESAQLSEDLGSLSVKEVFFKLTSLSDRRLPGLYTFSARDVAADTGIDEELVRNVLREYSLEPGDLTDYPSDHLYLSNPVWLRPIVQTGDDSFFCVMPQVFFSFVMPALGRLAGDTDTELLSKHRSDYLEEKIQEIVLRRFPAATTASNVKWSVDGKEYETDLITCVDSHLLIIEAKSGGITDPALRGAPERLRKHIDEVLVDPNLQSKRLQRRLEQLIADPSIQDGLRDKVPVDLSTIHRIVRVSVSLADVASLQANLVAQLKETGWLPNDYDACPSMTLADFETLFDFLEHPIQILHYLVRRQELETTYKYVGDELDLMALYIDTLFNLGNIDPEVIIQIGGASARLDKYYMSRDEGILIDKPQPKISNLFAGILAQLEVRKTPRWTEIGVILNRFAPEDQRYLTRMIRKLRSTVSKDWMISGHKNMVICVPKASEYALAYVVVNNHTAARLGEFVAGASQVALQTEHVKQCIVIVKNMDNVEGSYDYIALTQ